MKTDILLPDPAETDPAFKKVRKVRNSGRLCPDTLESTSASLKKQTGIDAGKPVVMAGHQPVFYHPGLLAKDLSVHYLAKRYDATALNLILDTDEITLSYSYPAGNPDKATYAKPVKVTANLQKQKAILRSHPLDDQAIRTLRPAIDGSVAQLNQVFTPVAADRIRSSIHELTDIAGACEVSNPDHERYLNPATVMRQKWLEKNGYKVTDIYASDLFASDAFLYFLDYISEHADRFRKIHNSLLNRYRQEHNIKNPAQPVPDLSEIEKELPFWLIQKGNRLPLTDSLLKKYRNTGTFYPKALTLSLFLRLFLADLFIHGTGGGRYDQITDGLLHDFFECDAAPYFVATATLPLEARADYPVEARTVQEVQNELRTLRFDPVRFLPHDCKLREDRQKLIQKYHSKTEQRSLLHREFLKNNRVSQKYLTQIKKSLETELKRSQYVEACKSVLADRTFPFFFYDLKPLTTAAALLETA